MVVLAGRAVLAARVVLVAPLRALMAARVGPVATVVVVVWAVRLVLARVTRARPVTVVLAGWLGMAGKAALPRAPSAAVLAA